MPFRNQLEEIVILSPRRCPRWVLTVFSLAALASCDVGTDPLDPATVTLTFNLPVAGELIDRVQRVNVRVVAQGTSAALLDTTFAAASGAGPYMLEVPVEHETESVTATVRLLGARGLLFAGEASASLQTGFGAALNVAASPVPAAVVVQKEIPTFTAIGDELPLSAYVTLSSGDTIPGLTPDLTTANPAVATMVDGHVLRSTGEGQTEVVASFEGKTDATPILVEAIVVGISIEPEVLTVRLGTTNSFEATGLDANGNRVARDATWASQDPNVATVGPGGTVTPVTLGEASVIVTIETFPATATVKVAPGPATLEPQVPEPIGTRVVTLRGGVNPNGAATSVRFEWSSEEAFTNPMSGAPQEVPAGTSPEVLSQQIKGLSPSTTYYFRLRASNEGGASQSATSSFATADPTGGFIEGRVAVEGEVLEGATLALSGGGTTTSDAEGRYSFEDVPLGAYTVTISGFAADVTFTPTGRSAEVTSVGQVVTTDFDGSFVRTSTVEGAVTASGAGVAGVTVSLNGPDSGTTSTSASGQYSFSGIRSGSYSVSVSGFDPDSVGFTATTLNTSVAIGQTKVVHFAGVDLGIQTLSVFAFVGLDGSKPGVSPVSGVQVDLYPTQADAGALTNRLGRTTTDGTGRAEFVYERGDDTAEGGGKTDNRVYSVVTGMPAGNLAVQADSVMNITYGQTEIVAQAGDTIDIVNGDVTVIFYLQTIFTSYSGPEGSGLFKPGWTTSMYTDTTAGAVASFTTAVGGRSTFALNVPVTSLPVTYYFRANDSQSLAAQNTWTQTPEPTSNGGRSGRFLRYTHDGTGPSVGTVNIGTERLEYLTQSLFAPVYHEVNNATATAQYQPGADDHVGANKIRVEVLEGGTPPVWGQNAASGTGHVVWNGVFDAQKILTVRAVSTASNISIVSATEYTVGFQAGGSVGAFGPGLGGFRHSARVCPLTADTAIANCKAFAYQYNNTEVTTNIQAAGGGNVSGMSVALYRCVPPSPTSCSRDGGPLDTRSTNGSGNVVFRDLLEGIYEVVPDPGSAGYSSVTPDGDTPLVVTSGDAGSSAKNFTANP